MAKIAGGDAGETFRVATLAVKLDVVFVQLKPGHRMIEFLRRPFLGMAGIAFGTQSGQVMDALVAIHTLQIRVIGLEVEATPFGVVEPTRFGVLVAVGAIVLHIVTEGAILMGILANVFHLRGFVMASATVLLLMAVDTGKTETFDVFLVMESDNRPIIGHILDSVNPFFRRGDVGMKTSNDVGHILGRLHGNSGIDSSVTDGAIGLVTPFAMAAETLTVVGALQTGLSQVLGLRGNPMALLAFENGSRRVVVVTNIAPLSHHLHVGVQLVRKNHWNIDFRKFAEDEEIGQLGGAVDRIGCGLRPWAGQQAWLLKRGGFAVVAARAVHPGSGMRLSDCGVGVWQTAKSN